MAITARKAARVGGGERNQRASTLLPWAIVLASTSILVVGWWLVLLNGESLPSYLVPASAALSFPLVGALIIRRDRGNRVGWILSTLGSAEALALVSGQYAHRALIVEPGSLPFGPEMAWVSSWIWLPGLVLLTSFLLLLFPDGRLPGRRWRTLIWLIVLLLLAMGVAIGFSWPHRGVWMLRPGPAPPQLAWVEALGGTALAAYLVLCVPASAVGLFVRFRRSAETEHRQIKWFVYAAALTVVVLLASQAVPGSPWTEILGLPLVLLIPAGTGVAILRHRLYDIDLLINRSLVFAGVSATLVGLYAGTVALLQQLFERFEFGGSLVAAGVVAVAFQPLRERLQRAVNRLMYGDRDDPYAALSRLGRSLAASIPTGQILQRISETVAESLRLPYAAIELPTERGFAPVANHGQPVPDVLHLLVVYQGEVVGRLAVGPRSVGEGFSKGDLRVLGDLAREAGPAVQAVRLALDLQRSGERIVMAQEEERRRVRRDLHDDLGPALAGIALQIEAARDRLRGDPEGTEALLGKLVGETQVAIAAIRRIAYDLRPTSLDELGLVGAIREEVTRFASDSGHFTISVEAPGELPPLPAAVEVAAYRIVLEGITNAVRHAGGTSCVVRLAIGNGLEVEVRDDGCGLPEEFRAGVGLASMRERATQLGGTLSIRRGEPSGTTILARLPVGG